MEEKLTGLVLSKTDYGENDRMIKIFTLESGMISASLKGVKKAGAKLKFASEPFCFAEFTTVERSGKRTVTGASLNDSFYPLREDVSRYFAAGAVLEFIRCFAKENIVSPQLFFCAIDALKEMAYGKNSPRFVLCSFLISALKITGYALNTLGCFACGKEISGRVFFEPLSGGFMCENCHNKDCREINASTYFALKKIEKGESIADAEAVFALRLLDFYIRIKTEEKITCLQELLK